MHPPRTTPDRYTWEWAARLSDKDLKMEVSKSPNQVISDLAKELLTKKKSQEMSRELVCKVLVAYQDISVDNFEEFFSALDKTRILEDTLHQTRPSLGILKTLASHLKLTHLSSMESFVGLSEDETMGKLYNNAIKSKNEALAHE